MMGSGMNLEKAKEYAKTMTYRQAVANVRTGRNVLYKKATMIKLRELAEIADRLDRKTQMWTCPKCGTENHIDFKICPCCGYDHKPELTESEYADAYNRGFASAVAMMADRKTEPTSSKMEQVDKDINVRSKDEPYIDIETGILHWCGWKYKRIYEDEPQTDCAWGEL